jgi:hypothetical protein
VGTVERRSINGVDSVGRSSSLLSAIKVKPRTVTVSQRTCESAVLSTMSTTLQTIEPDEPTVPANPPPPTRNAEPSRPALGAIAGSTTPGDTEAGTALSPARVLTHLPMRLKASRGYFVRCDIPDRLSRGHSLISYGLVCAPRRALRPVLLPHSRHSDLHPLRVFHR